MPGLADNAAGTLQTDADAVGLERRQQHGEIPRVLVHDLAALLAFFLERFERGRNRRHQLNDDRGRDVRHDVEREDRHPVDAATGEHVEHAENAAGLGIEDLRPGVGIDAGQRDIRAEAIDQQRADREPDALLEFFGLGERREIEIGRQLFRCRNHRLLPRPPTLPAAISLRTQRIRLLRPSRYARTWPNGSPGFRLHRQAVIARPTTRQASVRLPLPPWAFHLSACRHPWPLPTPCACSCPSDLVFFLRRRENFHRAAGLLHCRNGRLRGAPDRKFDLGS